jgi:hypothetical protein
MHNMQDIHGFYENLCNPPVMPSRSIDSDSDAAAPREAGVQASVLTTTASARQAKETR